MKVLGLLIIASLIGFSSFGQDKKLRAYLDSKQFYAPGVGNYVEFQLQFVGYSLEYKGKDEGLYGELAIRMKLSQEDAVTKKDVIVQEDAYRLETPFMKDSIIEDFYDLKRFVLAPGNYKFEIELYDLNSQAEPMKASQMVIVTELGDAISISDIEIAEIATPGDGTSPFYRSGYDIIPKLSTFYPAALSSIPVYFEIYNSEQLDDSIFGVRQTIENTMTGAKMTKYTKTSKHHTSSVVPFLRQVAIDDLPTGKYMLNYTILTRSMNELSTQTYEFERSNDVRNVELVSEIILDPKFQESITDDSIGYFLECLIPISQSNEIKNIISISKTKSASNARRHIQMYWNVTSPDNPYEAWMAYKAQVSLVNRSFSNNFQTGYETDRGRVYLQYGSPTNIIVKDNNMNEYPFEIWQYNKIGRMSNKRFIFYNPDLVNNAYRILHSDVVGELKNPGWQQELSKRNTGNGDIDNPNGSVQDQFGGNAIDYYDQY
ncbi:MAG: GWxTD domain-containing protein [Flavobacteriaceae bacterium]|jgi:GWxTD domain-containing protein